MQTYCRGVSYSRNCKKQMPAREKHLHIYLVQYQKRVCFRGIRNKVGTLEQSNQKNGVIINYRGSPTYMKITNMVSTTMVFGLCTCIWGIFCVSRGLTTVPLTRISCNTFFFKSQNVCKVGVPLYQKCIQTNMTESLN